MKARQNFASSPLLQRQQEITGLLGDPTAVGVGGHAAQVDVSGVEFENEQPI